MEEFRELRDVRECNLMEINRRLGRKERERQREKDIGVVKTVRSNKVQSSSSQSLVRKRQAHSPVLGMFLKNSKTGKIRRDESPLDLRRNQPSLLATKSSLAKKNTKSKDLLSRQRHLINRPLDSSTSKYTSLSPYASRNTKKIVPYNQQHQYSSEDSMSRGIKSYSALRLNSTTGNGKRDKQRDKEGKRVQSSKMITIESNTSKDDRQKRMFQGKGKRKRMYSHQKL